MFKKIIAMIIIMCIVVSATGCASIKNGIKNATYSATNGIAENKLTKYLKDKYPEKDFTVKSIDKLTYLGEELDFSFDESLSDVQKLTLSFWELTDENGNKYNAIVNNFNFESETIFSVADNVQIKEIHKAIEDKIYEVFEVEKTDKNFFMTFCTIEYTETKFNGDIVEFLNNHNFLGQGKDKIFTIYFYQDCEFDYTKALNEKYNNFFKHFADSQAVKFAKNMPTEETVKSKVGNAEGVAKVSNFQLIYKSNLPDIESVKTLELSKTNKEEWVTDNEFKINKQDEMYYTTQNNETIEKILCTETPTDISKWDEAIKEYQAENNEKWSDYKIITKEYKHTNKDINYYFEKPEQKENVVYKLFTINDDGETKVSAIYDQYKTSTLIIAWAHSNIAGNYMFISSDDIPSNGNWFIVECELEAE